MTIDAIKLELIEWLTQLDDDDTIEYLKIVKDSNQSSHYKKEYFTNEDIAGIERGLADAAVGRLTPHETVKKRYDLHFRK